MTLRTLGPEHAEAVAHRAALAFGPGGEDELERWRARLDSHVVLGWEEQGEVVAHAVVTDVDHWFGGRRLPCQNVAAVAIAPEQRGRGFARRLMESVIRRGSDQGLALSLLYPATSRLYRSLGYEHAGELVRYQVAASAVPAIGDPLRPAGEADWDAIVACSDRANAGRSGPAVRPATRLEAIRKAAHWYVLDGPGGQVEAYLLFDQVRDPGDWQYRLSVIDWAASSTRGLQAVVGFVGRHGTIGKEATFRGPAPDLWSQYVPEQDVKVVGGMWWMARGLDLTAAVTGRGYPPGLSGAVTLAVEDSVLAQAAGPWRLEISGREAKLTPSDSAEVRLDARAFGPLYTGFRAPADLVLADLLEGPEPDLAFLGAAFAGPVPHLLDFF